MRGFEYRKNLLTKDAPVLTYFMINNSETITIGDSVMIDSNGHITVATAGEEVLGIVQSVVDADGKALAPDSGTLADYTVDSDNETVDQYKAGLIIDKYSLFANDADDDLAQTNVMQFFDVISESQIDASSASDTTGQFQLISLDPDGDADASKGLFRIAESNLDPYAQA